MLSSLPTIMFVALWGYCTVIKLLGFWFAYIHAYMLIIEELSILYQLLQTYCYFHSIGSISFIVGVQVFCMLWLAAKCPSQCKSNSKLIGRLPSKEDLV